MKNVVITGASSGLGKSLSKVFRQHSWSVINVGRSPCEHAEVDFLINFASPLQADIETFGNYINNKDVSIVILNAGTLEFASINEFTDAEIGRQIQVNCLGQKFIIDSVIAASIKDVLFLAISSGASVDSVEGWGGYCIAKTCMNMLMQCYAKEFPSHGFYSMCPGLVKTSMQSKIYNSSPASEATDYLRKEYESMPSPDKVANDIFNSLKILGNANSGDFLKLRKGRLARGEMAFTPVK